MPKQKKISNGLYVVWMMFLSQSYFLWLLFYDMAELIMFRETEVFIRH